MDDKSYPKGHGRAHEPHVTNFCHATLDLEKFHHSTPTAVVFPTKFIDSRALLTASACDGRRPSTL